MPTCQGITLFRPQGKRKHLMEKRANKTTKENLTKRSATLKPDE